MIEENIISGAGITIVYEWKEFDNYGNIQSIDTSDIEKENWFYSEDDAWEWLIEQKNKDYYRFDGMALYLLKLILP
jgi:hypothetical protein